VASFDRVAVDVRFFLTLGHRQRVLALRAYASKDDPKAAAGRVPFYLLTFLGGSHTLRAYESQRFRGEKLAAFQAEYRWEASPAIELVTFVDLGAVAARTRDDLGKPETDFGLGLRLKTHERTLLRLDSAWGDEGFKFLVRFSASY
jgi:outer membrane protein assembly factor BamA